MGLLLIIACLAASTWPRFGGDPVPRATDGTVLYLKADGREARRCAVTPPDAPRRIITVPGSASRGFKLFGTRLDVPPGTRSACPSGVTATSGPILLTYPLAENDPWVILPATVLASVGWVYRREPRRRRRTKE